MTTAMAAATTFHRATLVTRLTPRRFRVFSSISNGGVEARRQLVLYSKPGCCLCDGLKEKLSVAFSLGGPHSLHSVDLQVRDITTNPEWEQKYQYEIPVLARVLPDGTEEVLPRLSPRLGVELIQKKISTAFDQLCESGKPDVIWYDVNECASCWEIKGIKANICC